MLFSSPALDELNNLAAVRISGNDRAGFHQSGIRPYLQAPRGFRIAMATVAVQRKNRRDLAAVADRQQEQRAEQAYSATDWSSKTRAALCFNR